MGISSLEENIRNIPLVPVGVKGAALAAPRREDGLRRGELVELGVKTGESPLSPFLEDAL